MKDKRRTTLQSWRRTRVVSRAGWLTEWRFKRLNSWQGEIVQLHALKDIYVTRASLIVANDDERRRLYLLQAIKIPYFRDTGAVLRERANIFHPRKEGHSPSCRFAWCQVDLQWPFERKNRANPWKRLDFSSLTPDLSGSRSNSSVHSP